MLNYVLFSCECARDTEDGTFIVYSAASMHNAEQGDLSSDTMDTLRRFKNPICDLPRPETVQINEHAQVFVHDLNLFTTVHLLDETPVILMLQKLCSKTWKFI